MAHSTTRIATETTVRTMLLRNAVTKMPSRASKASLMLSMILHSVGSENARSEDSDSFFDAVRNMKMKGTMKTTAATRIATTSSDVRLTALMTPPLEC